jgi:hypothetical protein
MVNNVVMQQGCRVHEFEYNGKLGVILAFVPAQPGTQDHEQGPQPLAAAARYVAPDNRN